jgi:pyruvate/2-oxoglutarate dehydrogenase complex dihydrolipoamide acyltransferase (E2) component
MKTIASIALIGALATFSVARVAAADGHDHSLEQVLVESAQTPAGHEALAHHFHEKAEAAREEAAAHEKMGKAYLQGKTTERMQMQKHCQKIAESLRTQADELDAMASVHEAEAKKLAR